MNPLSNIQIVCMAILEIGGNYQQVDIEDIAIKAYQINPDKFCWRKHPEMIDIRNVQYALKNAMLLKPPLITGSIKNGYMINQAGIEFIKENNDNKSIKYFRTKTDKSIIEIEKNRLIKSTAYIKYSKGEMPRITLRDFEDFLRVKSYFTKEKVKQRITFIENVVKNEKELNTLWQYLKNEFKQEE